MVYVYESQTTSGRVSPKITEKLSIKICLFQRGNPSNVNGRFEASGRAVCAGAQEHKHSVGKRALLESLRRGDEAGCRS